MYFSRLTSDMEELGQVRLLKRDELPLARIVLGKAFRDDPFIEFLLRGKIGPVPNRDLQEAKAGDMFYELSSMAIEFGATYTTADFGCVALWRPPGHGIVPLSSMLARVVQMVGVFGLLGSIAVMGHLSRLDERHPTEPHWYLQTIGTAPEKQGLGRGKAVMQRHLDVVDKAGLPCYLECTKESNISWYRRFGFELLENGVVSFEDGPSVWLMWRPARTAPPQDTD